MNNTNEANNSIDTADNTGLLMEVKTIHLGSFKKMTEALKESLKDATFKFSPMTYDESGKLLDSCCITVTAMNPSNSVLIKLRLLANKFEKYFVKNNNPIKITVNMNCFNKLIKTIKSDDEILTLFLEEKDPNHLGIKIDNADKSSCTIFKLIILDSKTKDYNVPNLECEAFIAMPSNEFQSVINNMSVICDAINIAYVNGPTTRNTLIFYGKGEFASQKTIYRSRDNENDEPPESELIIQGIYDLRNLSLFSKCSNLCHNVEMYMKTKSPLVIKYQIANLGNAHLILSTKVSKTSNVSDVESESDNEEDDENIE